MGTSRTCLCIFMLSILCSLGNEFSINVILTGKISDINYKKVAQLTCKSSKEPILRVVEFFVDNNTADIIRFHGGKCYHSKGECNSKICTCSKDGSVFIWIFHPLDMLKTYTFGCQVRILDEKNNTVKTTATLLFDGSEFFEQQTKHENIAMKSVEVPNPNGNDTDSTGIVAVVSIIVVCIIAAATVSLITFFYRKRNGTNERSTGQPFLLSLATYNPSQQELGLSLLERQNSQNTQTSTQRECTKLTTSTSTTEIVTTRGEDFPPTPNSEQGEDGLQKNEKLYELNLKKEHDLSSYQKCTVDSMVITGDSHLLIVDIENNCLKFLDEENKWHNINEPKLKLIRVTPLYKNVIAAIFLNEEKIQYIQISSDKMNYTGKEIDLKKLGKPLNIVYNKDHFAVRFGLGLKGRFVILNTEGNILHIISNSKKRFGDFNANSVEVALSLSEGCIFISSFDKNTVYCVNFDGQTLWTTPVACPKGILYVSNTAFLRQRNIILACQCPNVIYQIDSMSGKLTLLIEEKDGLNVTKCIGYKETETEYLLYTDSNTGKIFEFSLTAKNL